MTEAAVSVELHTDRPAYYWDALQPISYDEERDTWDVWAYHDAAAVLGDRSGRFSQGVSDEVRLFGNPTLAGLWAADGKRHKDLLALVAPAFLRRALASLEADIRRIVVELIDAATAAGDGQFEAVSTIARPLPGRVMCGLLGIDAAAAERMYEWRDEAWRLTGSYKVMPPQPDMAAYFEQLIDEHQQTPRPGLLDKLLKALADPRTRIDGQRLTKRDLVGYLAMLVWAGAATTAGAAADVPLFLTESGHWATLREQPALIPGAVEEVLRWYPSFPGVRLSVTADTKISGQLLRKGDWVTVWLTSANRDPRVFKNPNTFDIRRTPNDHLTFGRGPHFCLGAPLARLELRILIEQATQRLPELRRNPDLPLRRRVWMEDSLDEAHFRY
jgi:cytochrome P450